MKLSASAERQLARIADEVGAVGIKLSLVRTGCNGYAYKFDLVEDPSLHNHTAYSFNTVNIFISDLEVMFLGDVEIDYVDQNLGSSFTFKNPLEEAACGCGKSISLKTA